MPVRNLICVALLVVSYLGMTMPPSSAAQPLPPSVTAQLGENLEPVGSSIFRKFGFKIYNVTLFAPGGKWDVKRPYALQLQYTRDVSKDTLIDNVMGDIQAQNVADDTTLQHWQKILKDALPDVSDGDVMTGVAVPSKPSTLFINGKSVASIDDDAFSQAFFNIWIGPHADEDMRNSLLNKDK